jgi:hypothetical protein
VDFWVFFVVFFVFLDIFAAITLKFSLSLVVQSSSSRFGVIDLLFCIKLMDVLCHAGVALVQFKHTPVKKGLLKKYNPPSPKT